MEKKVRVRSVFDLSPFGRFKIFPLLFLLVQSRSLQRNNSVVRKIALFETVDRDRGSLTYPLSREMTGNFVKPTDGKERCAYTLCVVALHVDRE